MEEDADPGNTFSTHIPTRPNMGPRTSVFLTYLASVLGNPHNKLPNGALWIDPDSLGVIQRLMEAEVMQLLQMEKCMDQMLKTQELMMKEQANL